MLPRLKAQLFDLGGGHQTLGRLCEQAADAEKAQDGFPGHAVKIKIPGLLQFLKERVRQDEVDGVSWAARREAFFFPGALVVGIRRRLTRRRRGRRLISRNLILKSLG